MDLLTRLVDTWERCYWPNPGGLRLLSVRGSSVQRGQLVPRTEQVDHWCDTIFAINAETGYIDHWTADASTPGMYWDQKVNNAPQLRPGCVAFQRGVHRGEYPCLVQWEDDGRGEAAVIRDTDQNAEWSVTDDTLTYDQWTGFHIHHSGCDSDERVGAWSCGCTVLLSGQDDEPWQAFWSAVTDAQAAGQDLYYYGIVPYAWTQDTARRLLWGSVDKSQKEMTQLRAFLNAHDGSTLEPTGRFDQLVDEAYRGHQRYQHVEADGVCCNASWLIPPKNNA